MKVIVNKIYSDNEFMVDILKDKVIYYEDGKFNNICIYGDNYLYIEYTIYNHKFKSWERLKESDNKDIKDLQKIIDKYEKKNFILTESQILIVINDMIKDNYNTSYFRTQVEIAGSIVDGLAFIEVNNYTPSKIIAFEVKGDKDNYKRLIGQIESYIHLVDEVYLIIQNKEIPKDLPFFIGVIRCNEEVKILRKSIDVRHSIDHYELWETMIKNTNRKIGIPLKSDLKHFFTTIENLERKLIWNQFVVGFHQSYVKKYLPLTEDEKNILILNYEGGNIK